MNFKELIKTKKFLRLERLCKMLDCIAEFNNNNQISLYAHHGYTLLVANTDVNEALHTIRQYNKKRY